MGWVIAGIVGVLLLSGAFWLGYRTGRKRWAWLAAVLPGGMLIWTGVIAATEDKSDCYEACGSAWMLVLSVLSVLPALVLAGAIALGATVSRPGPSREARRGRPASS